MCSDIDPSYSCILVDTKVEVEDHGCLTGIKVEHDTFTNHTKTLQPALMKIESHDESSLFESKYKKEEEYMTWEEGGDVASSSSSYGLTSEIDLEVMKMEEDEDITIHSFEGKDRQSDQQNSSHNVRHVKHTRVFGEKRKKTFNCIKCERKYSSKCVLDGHIIARHSNDGEMVKIHRCRHCSFITVQADALSRHMRTHGETPEKSFCCIKCRKEFSTKQILHTHIVTQHSNDSVMINSITSKLHRCEYCSYITVCPTNFKQHMRTHGEKGEKTFNCVKCRKEFSSKLGLDGHIVTWHSNDGEMMSSITYKIHRCKRCSFITVQVHCLSRHMRSHGENLGKTFVCVECRKEFSNKQLSDGHIVTRHSDNDEMMNSVTCKIHRCKRCSYITVCSTNFTQHMRTHGEKPEKTFGCVECRNEFSYKLGLDAHIVTQHRNVGEMLNSVTHKIHRCKHCEYITVYARALSRHIKKHGL